MTFDLMMPGWRTLTRNAEGAGGGDGGEGEGAEGAGDLAAAAAAAADDGAAAAAAAAPAAKWFENETLTPDHLKLLEARGLKVDDPVEAVRNLADAYAGARSRIGGDPENLIGKPGETPLAEWRRANAETFGLPAEASAYAVEAPEAWPKDVPWDEALAGKAQQMAFDRGLDQGDLTAMVGMFAEHQAGMLEGAQSDLASAQEALNRELDAAWGDQKAAKVARAQQAAQSIAEAAGISGDDLGGLAATLSGKTSDATVLRMFDKIGELMGDDRALGLGKGGSIGMTPEQAQAELATLRGADGAYAKAVASNDQRAITELQPKIDQLSRIAAGSAAA